MMFVLLVILMVGVGGGVGSGAGGEDNPDGWDAFFMQVSISISYLIYLSTFRLKRFEQL